MALSALKTFSIVLVQAFFESISYGKLMAKSQRGKVHFDSATGNKIMRA